MRYASTSIQQNKKKKNIVCSEIPQVNYSLKFPCRHLPHLVHDIVLCNRHGHDESSVLTTCVGLGSPHLRFAGLIYNSCPSIIHSERGVGKPQGVHRPPEARDRRENAPLAPVPRGLRDLERPSA
ncbi:hypothetical protein CDAR_289531 [Caerostris darwini]|uniref:Uncharacterized protein n=1 Tax=Caerostris darwini TaxID=1538125 RepID=A0AAV4UGN7_9ARAC|nr:hypothetical protein CDAR_289531 [Caerostris darwini]